MGWGWDLVRGADREGAELSAEKSEEDQIAISVVHEAILTGASFSPEAQSSEHPDRLRVIGEDTRVDPMEAELPKPGRDE